MNANNSTRETVVLVHGIWMVGVEMKLLYRRMRLAGYNVRQFRYPSVCGRLEDNIEALHRFVDQTPGETVHLVCHSLGGLLMHQFLQQYPQSRPGRVIALGSPFNGSWTAQRVSRLGLDRWIIGETLPSLLARGKIGWNFERDCGVIAGTYPLGVGNLFGGIPSPNDGTVTVEETKLEGVTQHLCAPVNHFGLLVSRPVFGHMNRFLREGKF